MRVQGINNRICNYNASFGRKPTADEARDMHQTIGMAYDVMETKERIAITHGSCFPAIGKDSYIGSPFGKAAKEYIKFLTLYGFNGNLLGPNGQLNKANENEKDKFSPYKSSAFAKNRLFIDLQMLKDPKYGSVLSNEDLNELTTKPKRTEKNYTYTDFEMANLTYDKALSKAYQNFRTKVKSENPEALALNKEFKAYLTANNGRNNQKLNEEAIFNVLSDEYKTDDFLKWNNETDGNLIPLMKKGNPEALERYNELYNNNKRTVNEYKFEQFLATKQIKETKEFRDKLGFKYISDMLVGCSKMDHWRYRDSFIEGYQIGAKENGNPQTWQSPILHPRKLFKDDKLNTAGQFLQDKIESALDFYENVRVDHVMGLIEPYVIDNSTIVYDENNAVINDPKVNPIKAAYMSQMTSPDGKPLDDFKNYSCDFKHDDGHVNFHSNIMNKIVIPTLEKHGLTKHDPIWETICSNPWPFYDTYYNNLQMKPMVQLEYESVEKADTLKYDQNGNHIYRMRENDELNNSWFLVGSHDSIPATNMIKRDWTKANFGWDPLYLAGYLHQAPERAEERTEFCDKIANDDKERVKAKFAELLTTKKFQISFADLLGITDEGVVYNIGGEAREDNWKLRIAPDFIDKYYKNLASYNPTAINIPEVLKTAVHAKLDILKNQAGDDQNKKDELDAKFKPIIEKLAHYEAILKE